MAKDDNKIDWQNTIIGIAILLVSSSIAGVMRSGDPLSPVVGSGASTILLIVSIVLLDTSLGFHLLPSFNVSVS